MKFSSTLIFIFTILGLLASSCDRKVEVSEHNVSRIIQALSADEMKGRYAFSNEIDMAANFISSEFERIGLSPLPELDDYLQNFTIYTIKPNKTLVSVNGKQLNEQYYFALTNTKELTWKTDDVPVFYISEDEEFREAFSRYSSDSLSSVIVVAAAHEKWFHKYRYYFTRSNRTFELDNASNDVFILYNDKVNTLDIHFKNEIKDFNLFNVAGKIEGKRTDEIVLFSAHYDHIGVVSPVQEDSIANGANDNASGVAAVIELARYFNSMPKPERTLYFVAFTAEESGGFGSKYFSQQVNPDEIVAMFNIEMIGKPAVEGPNSAWITGFERSTFGAIVQNSMVDSSFVFYPDPYPNQNLFYRSDNATLARLGVPAHSISTTPIDVDQDYHRVTDEFNTLHIPHATNTIRAIAKAAKVIISGEETPTRIPTDSLD